MTTRRTVLFSLAGLPLAPGCVGGGGLTDDDDASANDDDASANDDDASPKPPLFEVVGEEDWVSFPSALQVGDATDATALVGFRAMEAEVVVHVGRVADDGVFAHAVSDILSEADSVYAWELTELQPDTIYELYAASADGARRSESIRFRSALAPGSQRPMTVAVTSCLGRSGAPWPSMSFVASGDPDVCLLLGDTVYADGATSLDQYRGAWEEALETSGLRDMSRSTSFIATWDDHEVDNNWTWSQHGDRVPAALAAFRESIPQQDGLQPDRVYRSLRWGDTVEFVVLDCRADRLDGRYIGPDQMAWLQDTLSTSTARFKIVLNSVPIIDFTNWIGEVSADDRWQGYPDDRDELLAFLEAEAIGGVLFVSGDMHFGSVCRVSPEGQPGANLWEVMAGPSGSFVNPISWFPPDNDQFDLVVAEWNTVRLTLDPATGQVGVTFVDDQGGVIGERLLEP